MNEGIKFWLWALIALFGLWLLSGGLNSDFAKGGPFIHPPAPLGSGSSYGDLSGYSIIPRGDFTIGSYGSTNQIKNANDPQSIQKEIDRVALEIKKAQDAAVASEYKGKIFLRSGSVSGTNANREYLEIIVDSNLKEKVSITGWQLRSTITYRGATIGRAASLPVNDQVNVEGPVLVSANDRLYINSGRSPIGISFKTNLCTGFFGQFQEYTPSLRNDCPRPIDQRRPLIPSDFVDACEDYLSRMSSCRVPVESVPPEIGRDCNNYISNNVNYQSCILTNKYNSEFNKPEWRIFLKQDSRLWKDRRDVIQLLDLKGKIVDTLTY